MTNDNEPDPMGVGEADESERAEEVVAESTSDALERPEDDRAEAELKPLDGGAETIAELEEEERPPEGPKEPPTPAE